MCIKKNLISFVCLVVSSVSLAVGVEDHCADQKPVFSGLTGIANPTTEDVMRLGQLGGNLCPILNADDVEPKLGVKTQLSTRSATTAPQTQQNKAFGGAMELWNQHDYKQAYVLLEKYLNEYPDGLWAGEAQLHMGCDARFNGRYTEADKHFNQIIDKYGASNESGAVRIVDKAKSRLAVLRFMENNPQQAKELFNELSENSKDWRLRTYAQHWLKRIHTAELEGQALADCGYRALESVLAQNGKTLKGEMNAKRLSTLGQSLKELKVLAKHNDLSMTPVKATLDNLDNLKTPFIAQIDRSYSGGAGHYWVVEQVKGDDVQIYDAQSQRRFLQKKSEFAKEWKGYALVFDEGEELTQIAISDAVASDVMGGCCGIQRPEDDLGEDDDPENEQCGSDKGCPEWKINMKNMNIFMSDTPLWYNTAYGPDVRLRLSYNSQSALAQNEVFGAKWQLNYGSYVVEDPGQSATVFMPTGARIPFTSDGNGGFQSRADVKSILRKLGEQHYELTLKSGDVYTYQIPKGTQSQQVFLTKVTDVKGHSLKLEYNERVQLVSIVDAQGRKTTLEYDEEGFVTKVQDPFSRKALFTYTDAPVSRRTLASITDMGGFTSNIEYDANLYPSKVIKPYGEWGFKVEPSTSSGSANGYPPFGASMWANYRITVTDPEGDKSEYHYDGFRGYSWYVSPNNYKDYPGNKTSTSKKIFKYKRSRINKADVVYYEDGSKKEYVYGRFGSLILIRDENGQATRYEYNDAKQKIKETQNGILVKEFKYLSENINLISEIKDYSVPFRVKTTFLEYDDHRNLLSVSESIERSSQNALPLDSTLVLADLQDNQLSNTRITRYTYNDDHQLISIDGSRNDVGDITKITYHTCEEGRVSADCGQPKTVTNAKGHVVRFENYDASGHPKKVTDVNGLVKHLTYDLMGRLISLEYTNGTESRVTQYKYAGVMNKVSQVLLPSGEVINYTYDTDKHLIQVTNNYGDQITLTRDKNGNVVKRTVADSTGNIVSTVMNEYNARNFKVKSLDAYQNTTNMSYHGDGQMRNRENPLGAMAQYGLDSANHVQTISATEQGSTKIQNTVSGLPLLVTDARGVTTRYTYNGFGEVIKLESQDAGTTHYSYDEAGNRIKEENAKGQVAGFFYDELNRLNRVTRKEFDNTEVTNYTWDAGVFAKGKLSNVSFDGGSTKYAYNQFGDLVQETNQIKGKTYTVSYEYNANGQKIKINYPNNTSWFGAAVQYIYDKGRVKDMTFINNGVRTQLASNIQYHPFGGVKSYILGNGTQYTESLNANGQLLKQTYGDVVTSYGYDAVGDITHIMSGSSLGNYGYDLARRLNAMSANDASVDYEYDVLGNRLASSTTLGKANTRNQYIYGENNNGLLGINNSELKRDVLGNLVKDTQYSYAYNVSNRLSKIQALDNEGNALDWSMEYTYHPDGYRIEKTGRLLSLRMAQKQVVELESKLANLGADIKANKAKAEQSKKALADYQQQVDKAKQTVKQYEQLQSKAQKLVEQKEIHSQEKIKATQDAQVALTKQKEAQSVIDNPKSSGWDKFVAGFRLRFATSALNSANNRLDKANQAHQKVSDELSAVNVSMAELEKPNSYARTLLETSSTKLSELNKALTVDNNELRKAESSKQQAQSELTKAKSMVERPSSHTRHTVYSAGNYWPLSQYTYGDGLTKSQHYVYLNNSPIAMVNSTHPGSYDYYYYQTNQINVPVALVNENNQTVWKAHQQGFGIKVAQANIEQPLRFPGQLEDEETGYYYNYQRYYDPNTGRYLQSDPIGLKGGLNAYSYVMGNPVSFVDPLGLYTLGDAKSSLKNKGVTPAEEGLIWDSFSDTQIFNEWLSLERSDTSWLQELTPCPPNVAMCTNENGWHDPKGGVSQSYHPGGVFEVRSFTTPGNHSNQCIYDADGALMKDIPAAGTADFRPCPIKGLCMSHYLHDVKPFELADKLGRVKDYYDVRPSL